MSVKADDEPPLFLVLRHPGRVGMRWHVVFATRSRAEAEEAFTRKAFGKGKAGRNTVASTRILELRDGHSWPDVWRDTIKRTSASDPPNTPHMIDWPARVNEERERREARAARRARLRIAALEPLALRVAAVLDEADEAEELAAEEASAGAGGDASRRTLATA